MFNFWTTRLLVLISLTTCCCDTFPSDGGTSCTCDFSPKDLTLIITCTYPVSGEISKCFESHPSTKHLIFRNSRLTSVPREVGLLHNVTVIDLSNNLIEELEFTHSEHVCRTIEHLVLDFNRIKVLRQGLLDCFHKLKELRLRNNTLKEIEDGAFNNRLSELEHVYMPYNDLVRFDTSWFYLPRFIHHHVVVVNVSFNMINNVTNSAGISIEDISALDSAGIDFIHNNFTGYYIQYYRKLFNVVRLVQLYRLWNMGFDFRFNPLLCDCSFYPVAKLIKDFRHMDPNNPLFMVTCYNPIVLRGKMVYSVGRNQFNCTVPTNCPQGCDCTKTIAVDLLTVHCADDYHNTTLPDTVPAQTHIVLNMHSSNLEQLDGRQYMVNVTTLDVSRSGVKHIVTSLLPLLVNIPNINLQDNIIAKLPEEIQHLNFTNIQTLQLSGNPYTCDCHTLWLKKWLIQRQDYIPRQEKIICDTGPGEGHPVILVNDADFVCTVAVHVYSYELISIMAGVLLVVIVAALVIHCKWTSIQVIMIAHLGIHCCRRKVKSTLKYDVFVSHSSKDDTFVYNVLIPMLENANPPFVLCLDERNFRPGETIVLNVITAIKTSLTTLLVVSNNFLRSDWCRMEFRQAHMKLLMDRTNIMMIVLGDIDQSLIDENDELKHYMNTNVYLKYKANDRYFWPKLLQTLPIRQQGNVNNLTSASTSASQPAGSINDDDSEHDRSPLLPNAS